MTQLEWHSPTCTSNATRSGYTLEHWSSINLVVPIVFIVHQKWEELISVRQPLGWTRLLKAGVPSLFI